MSTKAKEVSNRDILDALQYLEKRMNWWFDRIGRHFDRIEGGFDHVGSTMITKDYLDRKTTDFHED